MIRHLKVESVTTINRISNTDNIINQSIMKILHVSPAFYPAVKFGGPIYSLYSLCNELKKIGSVKLRVLTTDASGSISGERLNLKYSAAQSGYEVNYCRRTFGVSVSFELLFQLYYYVRWADVVHLTGVYSSPTIPTLFYCMLFRKPVLWSPRGAFYQWRGARRQVLKVIWMRICSCLISEKTLIHCTSDREMRDSNVRMPKLETVIIPNGVDIPLPLKKREISASSGGLRVMYLGLISPVKALDKLIDAMILVGLSHSLDVYGVPAVGYEDYYKSLVRRVRNSKELGNVNFHGFVGGEEKQRALESADILVVPSHSENFSNVVAEALAVGIPVIVSTGAPWSDIERHNCGLWVSNDPQSIASAILKLSNLDRFAMGENGRRWIASAFSWPRIAGETYQAYEKLIAQRCNNVYTGLSDQ